MGGSRPTGHITYLPRMEGIDGPGRLEGLYKMTAKGENEKVIR